MLNPNQFYEVLPDGRYKFRLDHHLIEDFNTCDRLFNYKHMQHWSGKGINFNIAAGAWWARAMELYYTEMSFGKMPTDEIVLRIAMDAWVENKVEDFKNTAPDHFDKFGGKEGACLMLLEYHHSFGLNHFHNWKILGAEMGFGWQEELLLGEDDEVVVYYGGKPDLIIRDISQQMVMPVEFKTKDSIPYDVASLWKPHPQTTGYIFAVRKLMEGIDSGYAPPTKCVVIVAARVRPTDKPRSGIRRPRFAPVYPNYTAEEIEEWRLSVMGKCARLRRAIERSEWLPRESSCHFRFGSPCEFRRACSVPCTARGAILKADFIQVEPWHPYVPQTQA